MLVVAGSPAMFAFLLHLLQAMDSAMVRCSPIHRQPPFTFKIGIFMTIKHSLPVMIAAALITCSTASFAQTRVEKVEKPEKVEKVEKAEKPEKVEKVEKAEKPEKVEKVEKAEKPEKVEKPEKSRGRG